MIKARNYLPSYETHHSDCVKCNCKRTPAYYKATLVKMFLAKKRASHMQQRKRNLAGANTDPLQRQRLWVALAGMTREVISRTSACLNGSSSRWHPSLLTWVRGTGLAYFKDVCTPVVGWSAATRQHVCATNKNSV